MSDKLNIFSSDCLNNISESEVNELVERIVEKSKVNMEEISMLTFECTALLSSAENRASALNNQGFFKRTIKNITGENQKLQNAILKDNTNALYVAQEIINRVMLECTYNRELLVIVYNRISTLCQDLEGWQNGIDEEMLKINKETLKIRKEIVAFYKKNQSDINEVRGDIQAIKDYGKSSCSKCGKPLLNEQKICSACGAIHPLKTGNLSEITKGILQEISNIVKGNEVSTSIDWDLKAQNTEKVLRKVKKLAEVGKLPGYTEELEKDIKELIDKCSDAEFQIAVVGVMKAGKSFLINALIGTEIASVGVNSETAALTKFRSADGYYIRVKFHSKNEWNKLINSAKNSETKNLYSMLTNYKTEKEAKKWIGNKPKRIDCANLDELRNKVKKYTSTQSVDHLFVSEVEVAIDRNIFDMPKEVVLVDTPGLKDPVTYRSDITKDYIKKADAVLIALKPEPLTKEPLEVVTTVLDYIDTSKVFIIGTQKDIKGSNAHEAYVSDWQKRLMEAKRYKSQREFENKVILTSAKMDVLLNKWVHLSADEKEDDNKFDCEDYNDLKTFAAKIMRKREYDLLHISEDEAKEIFLETGISKLRRVLKDSLIMNYRNLKLEDIMKSYKRISDTLIGLSEAAIEQKNEEISAAIKGTETLKEKLDRETKNKDDLEQKNEEVINELNKLEESIKTVIKNIRRG